MPKRTDVPAKTAFLKKLLSEGYTAEIKAQPSDIIAEKDGETWYFEIKMTEKADSCFGAATLTEWEQAFKTPDHYRFVIAIKRADDTFTFREFTPAEFMQYSTIPPFKVYFNLDLQGDKSRKRRKKNGAVSLTEQNFQDMLALYKKFKK
jgi:hypothetical protein